jgi:hypothetical protein
MIIVNCVKGLIIIDVLVSYGKGKLLLSHWSMVL